MVHPYLRRRTGRRRGIPLPSPPQPAEELSTSSAARWASPSSRSGDEDRPRRRAFSSAEANQLRRAMATFRSQGEIGGWRTRWSAAWSSAATTPTSRKRCFDQIKGFGEYGFPESHAASFAHLVYVSAWLKCHYPAAFGAALLNSQPMGFYAPAQIVRDMREHGVEVRAPDVNLSDWDTTLVPDGRGGRRCAWGCADRRARGGGGPAPHAARDAPSRRGRPPPPRRAHRRAGRRLAEADAMRSMRSTAAGRSGTRGDSGTPPTCRSSRAGPTGEEPPSPFPSCPSPSRWWPTTRRCACR